MSDTFKAYIENVRTKQPKQYAKMTLNLTEARTNSELLIQGNNIYIEFVSGTIAIRLNDIQNDPVSLLSTRLINGAFYRIFVTNLAQNGSVTFYYWVSEDPKDNDFSIKDAVSIISIGADQAALTQKEFSLKLRYDPSALQMAVFYFLNPPNSGVVAIIDTVKAMSNGTAQLFAGPTPVFMEEADIVYGLNKYIGARISKCYCRIGSLILPYPAATEVRNEWQLAYDFSQKGLNYIVDVGVWFAILVAAYDFPFNVTCHWREFIKGV